jgi:hypothetical protein
MASDERPEVKFPTITEWREQASRVVEILAKTSAQGGATDADLGTMFSVLADYVDTSNSMVESMIATNEALQQELCQLKSKQGAPENP